MKYVLLRTIIALSAIGLLLSLIVHVATWISVPIPSAAMRLHLVALLACIPTLFVGNRLAVHDERGDFWKAALRGCPPWMRLTFYLIFSYAVVNFIIFFVGTFFNPRPSTNTTFRGFSGYWMLFFAAALAICYSALHVSQDND